MLYEKKEEHQREVLLRLFEELKFTLCTSRDQRVLDSEARDSDGFRKTFWRKAQRNGTSWIMTWHS